MSKNIRSRLNAFAVGLLAVYPVACTGNSPHPTPLIGGTGGGNGTGGATGTGGTGGARTGGTGGTATGGATGTGGARTGGTGGMATGGATGTGGMATGGATGTGGMGGTGGAMFGCFENKAGTYSGDGGCNIPVLTLIRDTSIRIPGLGSNQNVVFELTSQSSARSSSSDLNLFGKGGHWCVLICQENSPNMLWLECMNAQGGSCGETFMRVP